MDCSALVNLSAELGCKLMHSGAEIYRVEDSVRRLMRAYGAQDAQVFAIPNCLLIGLNQEGEQPVTRLCRIPPHGIDLDMLELCNALCRRLCREQPPLEDVARLVAQLDEKRPRFSASVILLGHFFVAAGFTPFFGGGVLDALCGGLCGLAIGLTARLFDRISGSNSFFRTLLSSALSAFLALVLVHAGLASNSDAITVGALMLLVPGAALTTAIREIMASDIVSGVTRFAETLLTATAIALGTGLAMVAGQLL